jgi:CRP/FNR family transcriptional regulator, cyclic AMP receptor protein
MASIHALRHVSLVDGVSDADLAPLAACLVRRTFAKDVVIFNEGSPGGSVFIIESGRVRIYLTSSAGHEISLNVYGPGQIFGEISLLDGRPRSASAMALEQDSAFSLEREDFQAYMDAHPVVARNVIMTLTNRLRHTTTYAESLVFLDVPGRLAAKLLELASRLSDSEGNSVELTMTQSDLATWVAASRESVNKALSDLREQGLIELTGQHILIRNRRGLQEKILF